jgi:hemolysin III
MTVGVWSLAALGIAGKLFLPGLGRRFWVVLYLALGWLMVIAIKPMMGHLSVPALVLLVIGGAIYSIGTLFYVMQRLKFRRAIWHGHVVAGSLIHYLAVLLGVVLASGS